MRWQRGARKGFAKGERAKTANSLGRAIICAAALAFALLGPSRALDSLSAETTRKLTQETDLKAVFLFNFGRFVEWPPGAFTAPDDAFIIGVLGNDALAQTLEAIAAKETVRNRKLAVRHYRNIQEISACHVLYIGPSETESLPRLFQAVQGKNTLTVGESDAFSEQNGMIRFILVQNKMRLRINVEAATTAGLSISSQLLRQSEIVSGAKQ